MKKIKDHYFYKAKNSGYVARSIYKLEEIDKKHHLICNGNLVIDFGCSPGSWLQYTCKKVGEKGFVLGVDIEPVSISLPKNVKVLKLDIFEADNNNLEINVNSVDVILSDMAPKTTGIRAVDSQRSLDLNQQVLEVSKELLKPNGAILVKAFQGSTMDTLRQDFKKMFAEVKLCKPKSSRSESVEIFLLGRMKKIK